MVIRHRSAKKTNRTPMCSACRKRAASCDAIFLGTEFVALCSGCAKGWSATYEHALFGWPDEAERGRDLVAA